MFNEADLFRDILHRTTARYLTLRPDGLVLDDDPQPRAMLEARIVGHGAARTLYRGRKPTCRSLDAVKSVTDSDRRCQSCIERKHCTPQIRVDLFVDDAPYRLLLAYTSAKNFLLFWNELSRKGTEPAQGVTTLRVVHRGSWGELRFERQA